MPWSELITLLIMDMWQTLTGRNRLNVDEDPFRVPLRPGAPGEDDTDRRD